MTMTMNVVEKNMSNKFIWQKNRRGFDYLLVSDKTLNSYGDDDQDLEMF